ncbi:MAG TPA: aminotransferase class IV [Planctomycetota bacterium]|jgi:branched-chain amino acid aminotransferase|nr:aminotransferase IV [Planctomycetota bacterium]MDP6128431.1 aminotransferase class IV [Planctomycetota bacterium]MDP7245167.1 aminotransferase class IV [Planctomycetota bacterium]MDP7560890.1 aminotransferase class IV [Planctomycetota bacterium]HJM39444.1 aminotransferase class IV [Planctomycetota bacterium]|tara:strand:+ start:20913 stop:21830 length:918 start_codon:yes stop_codon:yes gene_type:complete
MLQHLDDRNLEILININGNLVPREEARVSPFDSLVQGGDGVWEGLRVYDGRIFKLEEHLDRMVSSAKALAFKAIPSKEEIIEQICRTLEANQMRDGVHIRLTLSRGEKITSGMDPRLNQSGPTLIVLAEWKTPVYEKSGLRLITSSVRRFPPDCLDPNIHHNNLIQSILAKVEANHAGADDAILLDKQGFVAETNATHIFAVENGILLTPTTRACPEGVTRATVLDLCLENDIPFEVCDLSLTHFFRADEVFTTGTMGELAGVVEIDGRSIGEGDTKGKAPGPLTERLSNLFRDLTVKSGYIVSK